MPSRKPVSALLEVDALEKRFPLGGVAGWLSALGGEPKSVRAVDGVSFAVEEGETLGLVGESGCGKSTVARCVLRLTPSSAGRIRFGGTDIAALGEGALRHERRHIQMVFQDPTASLNPRLSVRRMVEEPLKLHTDLAAGER